MAEARKVRTAILGWGSLLWEGGHEFDQWHEPWQGDGPQLRIEFSRKSKSRSGALTLVLDEENGALTTVAWCLSRRARLEDAICDLRGREHTTTDKIGRLDVTGEAGELLVAWAQPKKLDHVIWTALKPNFDEITGKPFSIPAAIAYLKSLAPEGKAKAAEYVWRAPAFVKTGLRSALQREPWFSERDN